MFAVVNICDMKGIFVLLSVAMVLTVLSIGSGCSRSDVESDPDVNVDSQWFVDMSITEPDRALARLDTIDSLGASSDFEIAYLRCLIYHNGFSDYKKALMYGLEAYNMPEARDDAYRFLNLSELIADEYYINGDYPQSVTICTEGIKMAKDSLLRSSEANLSVGLGKTLLELGKTAEGLDYLRRAVDILADESQKSDNYTQTDDYVYALGSIIDEMCDTKRFKEAMALYPRYEEALARLATKSNLPKGLVDQRRASGYAAFAYTAVMLGDVAGAAELYDRLCTTYAARTRELEGSLKLPYLLAAKRYAEALDCLDKEKELLMATTDTVSYEYVDQVLRNEQKAYEGLGDYRAANEVARRIQTMSDTLNHRDHQRMALEVAEIYKTSEQLLEIERQSVSITVRDVIIAVGVAFILLCVIFILRMLRYNRIMSLKNRAMINTINELMQYKDRFFAQEDRSLRLELPTAVADAPPADGDEVKPNEAVDADGKITVSNTGDAILFSRMNHEILEKQMFLDPDLSKTTIMEKYRIPAYRFSAFFKEQAGCSYLQYVNNCRLDYAVRLMREKPNWSIEAIAQAVCMSNSSFYSQFKKRFGISPLEYRKGSI